MHLAALRKLVPVFLLSLSSSCYQDYYDFRGTQSESLAKANLRNVELYFADDSPADPAYVKIAVVRVSGKKDETYDDLVQKLRERSALLGYDAVIRIIKGVSTETNTSLLDIISASEGEKFTANTLTGYGIRYLKNIESATSYKKSELVFGMDNGKKTTLVDQANFQLNGEFEASIPKNDQNVYQNYIRPFSFDYLVNEKQGWSYKLDETGRVISRRHTENGAILERCQFVYNESGKIELIRVSFRKNIEPKYDIELFYDEKGIHREKVVWMDKKIHLREKYYYDEQVRLQYALVFLQKEDPNLPAYRIDYEYFTAEDLKALNEEARKE